MRKVIYVAAWIALILVVLFDTGMVLGRRMPQDSIIRRQMMLNVPQQQVWQLISDVSGQSNWRSDIKSVERLPDAAGLQMWRENRRPWGSETFVTQQFVPPTYMLRMRVGDKSRSGGWAYQLEPAPNGTVLTVTQYDRIHNPFKRYVTVHIIGAHYLDSYLQMVAAKFGQTAQIR